MIQKHDELDYPDEIHTIAEAISVAEGYHVEDSIPFKLNNPGDLENSQGKKFAFLTAGDGWNALYRQVELMVSGRSKIYKPSMTWEQIGKLYDGEEEYMNWVNNVCKELEVTPESTLQGFIDKSSGKIKIVVSDSVNLGDKIG